MHRFEAPEEPVSGQAAEPMRLFLSYGHPESEICQRICAALKEHGYDPWFDQSDIRTGDNWRVSIQEGVRSSNAVVACLSPHSTRERGGGAAWMNWPLQWVSRAATSTVSFWRRSRR